MQEDMSRCGEIRANMEKYEQVRTNNSCAALIKHINDKLKKNANERLGIHDITFMQVQVLQQLRHAKEDALPLKSLEKHFEVAQSTAAGIIVRLERKELVSSFVPAEDKRLKYVRLTEKGKVLCDFVEADMEKGETELLAGLNEEEKEQLFRLLKKVNASLT